MIDRERIAELLVEPDISGMDWNVGSQILMGWKAGLPDRILSELGYICQPEYEPVELEALGDEEIIAEYESWADITPDDDNQLNGLRGVSQATIQKNQKKQLFRLKEVKNDNTSEGISILLL